LSQRVWKIYLAGEIHTNWRETICEQCVSQNLPIRFYSPVTDHCASDNCGEEILGVEDKPFWKDRKAAKLNAIRTRTLLREADVVVVKFGDKYRQWNAAFDAGFACAIGKPIIVIHDDALIHALKEVDAAAMAVASSPQQVVRILKYVIEGRL